MTAPASPLVEVRDLVVRFPASHGATVHALEGISFDVGHGETVGLVGESGSGKTTAGFTILGRYKPVSGEVAFDGRDLTTATSKQWRELRREMQMVFQDPYSSLNPWMTVGEIVAEPFVVHTKLGAAEVRSKVGELLLRVGLPASSIDRRPADFSGGERQRISIARAIALRPRLIVADEAVSALDVSIRAQIVNLLVDLQRDEGLSYLFISHDLGVVRHMADRCVVLYAGQVMEVGPTDRLFAASAHPYTRALLSATPIPDPDRARQTSRILLAGEPPDVLAPRVGCAFASRCPLATERCTVERPPMVEMAPGWTTACWYPDQAQQLKVQPTAVTIR